jgi:hypothetical protein
LPAPPLRRPQSTPPPTVFNELVRSAYVARAAQIVRRPHHPDSFLVACQLPHGSTQMIDWFSFFKKKTCRISSYRHDEQANKGTRNRNRNNHPSKAKRTEVGEATKANESLSLHTEAGEAIQLVPSTRIKSADPEARRAELLKSLAFRSFQRCHATKTTKQLKPLRQS